MMIRDLTELKTAADRDTVEALVERVAEQGVLTTADILEIWPEAASDVEAAREMLEEAGFDVARTDLGADHDYVVDFHGIDADDTVSLYFREVGEIELLSAAEEVALAQRIEAGLEARRTLDERSRQLSDRQRAELERIWRDGEQARKTLTQANSRLVISMAKRHMNQGVPFLDLIQEGNLGLMRAVEKFDWRRGNKFSTYATWWIRQSITRALADQGRTIRLPVHMNDCIRKVYAVAQALEGDLGRRPTSEEIAEKAELTPEKVEHALKVSRGSLSLEKPVGQERDSELGQFIEDDRLPDPTEAASREMLRLQMEEMLQTLTPREQRVLELRYGLRGERAYTLKEVGKKFGLTRERVRQIEKEALRKLRSPSRSRVLSAYAN
jgi:RNA polymerase primary sigma factor